MRTLALLDGHLPGSMGSIAIERKIATPFAPSFVPHDLVNVDFRGGSLLSGCTTHNYKSSASPRLPPMKKEEPAWGLLTHNTRGGFEPFASPLPTQRRPPPPRPLIPGTLPQPPAKWMTSSGKAFEFGLMAESMLSDSYRHPAAAGRLDLGELSKAASPSPSPNASPRGLRLPLLTMREHVSASGFSTQPFVSLHN